jgi:peptide deformylase
MVKIVQKDEKVLRQIAEEVPVEEITGPKIQKIIKDMKKALASQDDGVAIAAPQIGHSLRIFVMSGKVLELVRAGEGADEKHEDLVFINPKIINSSKQTHWVEEGCLSVRYLYGHVRRAKKATVEGYDENGKYFTRGGSNLIAQIFQHEVDHLDGILFIDKAKNLVDIPPEEQAKLEAAGE